MVDMEFKVGDRVNHWLYGEGEVIEGDVPKGDLLVHYYSNRSLDCSDGFHKVTAPFELDCKTTKKGATP